MSLTSRIKDLAEPLGHTFASLERELSLAQGSIRRWDSSFPSCDKLYKMANLLSVSMEFLLTGENAIPAHEKSLDQRLSDEAIDIAMKWDALDNVQQTIIKGRIYEAYQNMIEKDGYDIAKSG